MRLVLGGICAIFTSISAACATSSADWPDAGANDADGAGLDLSDYELTFSEDFDKLDVSGRRCDTRWIAHTPWNGDFGAAVFVDPSRGFPFRTRRGVLRIEARKDPSSGWLSGLLSAWNTCEEGTAQQYGYFEARMMLPSADGMWSAFWLIGVDRKISTAEIDIIEHHGHMADRFASALHVFPVAEDVEHFSAGKTVDAEPGILTGQFNTFGVNVEEEEMIFYLNRREVWRQPTTPEFRQPMYPLVNLAMDAGYVTPNTPKRAYLYVDYVRMYKRKP